MTRYAYLICIASFLSIGSAYTPARTALTDSLAARGLRMQTYYHRRGISTSCTIKNAARRREWGDLTKGERVDYTDAVLCLMKLPPLSDPVEVPGAKSRYDDFVATHINQTLTIHFTTSFLSWHRYFTWTFEKALRQECGYKGWQPYWNWGKYAFDPINSPIFDGSPYSISGNGAYEAHPPVHGLPSGINDIPPGNGGGCVESGPFKNMSVNLGPVAGSLLVSGLVNQTNHLAYNPRCLRRDISPVVSSNWSKDVDSWDLITKYKDISSFQLRMQGDLSDTFYGVHTAGHYTGNGDPGGDGFVSPGDPIFWMHHAQIDRTWVIWQNQDLRKRQNAIGGTITLGNNPPSRNGTLDDVLSMGVNGPDLKIRDGMNTLAGPYCYIYV